MKGSAGDIFEGLKGNVFSISHPGTNPISTSTTPTGSPPYTPASASPPLPTRSASVAINILASSDGAEPAQPPISTSASSSSSRSPNRHILTSTTWGLNNDLLAQQSEEQQFNSQLKEGLQTLRQIETGDGFDIEAQQYESLSTPHATLLEKPSCPERTSTNPTDYAQLNETFCEWLKRVSSHYIFQPMKNSIVSGAIYAKDHKFWFTIAILTALPNGINAFCMITRIEPKDLLTKIVEMSPSQLLISTVNAICAIGVNTPMNALFLSTAWDKLKTAITTCFTNLSECFGTSTAFFIAMAALIASGAVAYSAWLILPAGKITAVAPALLNGVFNFASRFLGALSIIQRIKEKFDRYVQLQDQGIDQIRHLKEEYKQAIEDFLDGREMNDETIEDLLKELDRLASSKIADQIDAYLITNFFSNRDYQRQQNLLLTEAYKYLHPPQRTLCIAYLEDKPHCVESIIGLFIEIENITCNKSITDELRVFLLKSSSPNNTIDRHALLQLIDQVEEFTTANHVPSIKIELAQFINDNEIDDYNADLVFAKIEELTSIHIFDKKTIFEQLKTNFLFPLFDYTLGLSGAAVIANTFDTKGVEGADIITAHHVQDLPVATRAEIGALPAFASSIFYYNHLKDLRLTTMKGAQYLKEHPEYIVNASLMTFGCLLSGTTMYNLATSVIKGPNNFLNIKVGSSLGKLFELSTGILADMLNFKVLTAMFYADHLKSAQNASNLQKTEYYLSNNRLPNSLIDCYERFTTFGGRCRKQEKPEHLPLHTQALSI